MKILDLYRSTNLMTRILVGIIIGASLALLIPGITSISILGDLFVGALKGIAPILVCVLVISSVSKAGSGLGGRFKTVISLYMLSTLLAAVLAVIASFIFKVEIALPNVHETSSSAPEGLGDIFSKIFQMQYPKWYHGLSNVHHSEFSAWSTPLFRKAVLKYSPHTANCWHCSSAVCLQFHLSFIHC